MNPISIDQLKARVGVTVGIVVATTIGISLLGVLPELSGTAGGNEWRHWKELHLTQSLIALFLCGLVAVLTRVLLRHLDDLKQTQGVIEGQRAQLEIKAAQIDAAHDVILQVDTDGRLVHFNQALCRLTGYTAEELAGSSLRAIEPPEHAELVEERLALLKERREATFESAYLSRDGREIPIEVHAHLTQSDGRPLILSIARDITQRRRLELREKSRLETLERIATDASLSELLKCVALFVEHEIAGTLCAVFLVDDSGTRLKRHAAPSLPEECDVAMETMQIGHGSRFRQRIVEEDLARHPCGEGFDAKVTGMRSCWSEPVLAPNGTLLGIIVVYHREGRPPGAEDAQVMESAAHLAAMAIGRVRADDGRRVLEEQLRHSQKIEAVGQLAAGVAHDFNNLLTPIIVYGDMLLRLAPEGSPQARMVTSMTVAAQKASDLTQKLLSFGRKQALHMDLLDLNEVIVSFREVMRATARNDIAIDLSLSPGAAKVQADRVQIEQVLLNLLLNAQDAIEGRGSVCLETGHLILDEDFHRVHPVAKPGHYILLAFSDDGCGMAEETLKHMYEPFFTTKEVGRGTGLGLATVYGIVKRHGGCIDVRSRPGEGTRFAIYLPASSSTADPIMASPLRPDISHRPGNGKTILLVEDNALTREVAGELLGSFGYRVLSAEGPSQALELAAGEAEIDLLATNLTMPEMGGPELYEKLRLSYPLLPVLYISGYTAYGEQAEPEREEAIFLAKPFTLEQFMARVGEMLRAPTHLEDYQRPLDHETMARLLRTHAPKTATTQETSP